MTEAGLDKLWDARIELHRMRAIVGALWYLSRPHGGDDSLTNLNEAFGIIEASLAETAEMLAAAFEEGFASNADKEVSR